LRLRDGQPAGRRGPAKGGQPMMTAELTGPSQAPETAGGASDASAGWQDEARYAVIAGEPHAAPRELIVRLVDSGYATLERPIDDDLGSLLRSVSPSVVVLCFRAGAEEAPRLIEHCAGQDPR